VVGEDDRRLPRLFAKPLTQNAGPEGTKVEVTLRKERERERRRPPPWQSTFDQVASSKVVDDEVAVESKYLSASCSYTVSLIHPLHPHSHIPAS